MPTALSHALRTLKRTPFFTTAATFTLVLGIGSVAAIFAIVDGVLLAPLPYGHPQRLVTIGIEARSPELRHIPQPPGVYFTFKRYARLIDEIGFYRSGNGNIWTGGAGDQPERVTATWITGSTIAALQVPPILGRSSFTADEDRDHGPDAAIISESVWRSRFNADRNVIGKTLYVNSVARIVVGVMPEQFRFPTADTRLWLPAKLDRDATMMGDFTYSGIARLAAGATPELAQRDLASVLPRIAELFPRLESGTSTKAWLNETSLSPVVTPLRDEITNGIARTLWMLAAAAALVLLVACANVANLMLIRGDSRQLELAVREALGASRWRILTHFLGESFVLSGAAGLIALVAAWAAIRALVAFGPADVPRLAELRVRLTTIAFVGVVSVLSAIICTAIPAVRSRRGSLSIKLRDGGRSDTAGMTRQRLRTTIAALQIAVAFVVLAASALLLRTFQRLHNEPPGFNASNVITVWMQLPFARYRNDSSAVSFYGRLAVAVRQLPSVRAAGLTTRLPLGDGETRQQTFQMQDEGRVFPLPVNVIDDGYLQTMHIPLVAGRVFQPLGVQRDGEMIISQRAASTLWNDRSGQSALGRRLALTPSGPSYTVIGVVGGVRDHDLATAPSATVYLPQAVPINPTVEPSARRTLALVVKTSGAPTPVIAAVKEIVRDLDPTVPIFNVAPMSDVVRASTARLSLVLMLMSAAAAITLLLGTIGLYGVVAYMVTLRTREFGVRIALGADPRQLVRTVAMRGLVMIACGLGAGLALFAVAAPFLRAFVYGVAITDPVTLAMASLALVGTTSIANWLPARRAARVDPAEALRAD
jgi:putative ABC transport system permease protein